MGYATQGYWGSSNWESISWIHKPNNHPHDDPYPGYPSNLFSSSTSLLGWPKKPGFLGFLRSARALFRWSTTWRTSAFQKPSLGSAQRKLFNELIGLNKHQSGIFLTSQNGIWYNGISMGYHWWDVINGIYHQQHWSVPTFMGHRKKKTSFWQLSWGKWWSTIFKTIGFGIPDFQTNSAISLNPCDSSCVLRLQPQVPQIFRPSWHPVLGSEPRKVARLARH